MLALGAPAGLACCTSLLRSGSWAHRAWVGAQRAWGLSVSEGEGTSVPEAPCWCLGPVLGVGCTEVTEALFLPFKLCQGLRTPFILTLNAKSKLFSLLTEEEAEVHRG